jgi:hypothetical protein
MSQEGANLTHLGTRLHYTLRVSSAMCFIGHGAFGIITKKIWLNYFAVFGIGPAMGYHIMPWLGTFDILLGVTLLIFPMRAVLFWLVIWGAITAMLRALSGEPFAEAVESAGNHGAPLALLMICGEGHTLEEWFSRVKADIPVTAETTKKLFRCLQVVAFMLLAGHGWLNLIGKPGLLAQYASLGFANPVLVAHAAGVFEVLAAVSILVRPMRPIPMGLLVWKMASELFYPQREVFEWIERGGSYGTILALWFTPPAVRKRIPALASKPDQSKREATGSARTAFTTRFQFGQPGQTYLNDIAKK